MRTLPTTEPDWYQIYTSVEKFKIDWPQIEFTGKSRIFHDSKTNDTALVVVNNGEQSKTLKPRKANLKLSKSNALVLYVWNGRNPFEEIQKLTNFLLQVIIDQ